MSFLILVKHSLPVIDPKVPAAYWELSDKGRQRCIPLAAALAVYHPGRVFTSREPKAIETGQIVASRLNLPCTPVGDLHEHRRLMLPFASRPEFEAGIAQFFAEPDNWCWEKKPPSRLRLDLGELSGRSSPIFLRKR